MPPVRERLRLVRLRVLARPASKRQREGCETGPLAPRPCRRAGALSNHSAGSPACSCPKLNIMPCPFAIHLQEPNKGVNPDEAVAYGAAVQVRTIARMHPGRRGSPEPLPAALWWGLGGAAVDLAACVCGSMALAGALWLLVLELPTHSYEGSSRSSLIPPQPPPLVFQN